MITLFLCVFFLELLYPSFGIQYLLFAGEERMALGADIELYIVPRGLCGKSLAAGAGDLYLFIFRMDSLFQRKTS